jgi:hypothetical protein
MGKNDKNRQAEQVLDTGKKPQQKECVNINQESPRN